MTFSFCGEQVACSLIVQDCRIQVLNLGLGYLGKYQLLLWVSKLKNCFNPQKKKFRYLKKGGVPIITGFQGIDVNNRITTIGRGGSDASAIVLAKFFKADRCIIYTDVEGVYTTDPKKLKRAKKIKVISYEEMLEMASLGEKVMMPVSIQDARLNRINIEVKSSFKKGTGTLITKERI